MKTGGKLGKGVLNKKRATDICYPFSLNRNNNEVISSTLQIYTSTASSL